jgi:hypothetical protein
MYCILCILFYAVCSMNYIPCILCIQCIVQLFWRSISNFETRWSPTDRQTERRTDGRTLSYIELLSQLKSQQLVEVNQAGLAGSSLLQKMGSDTVIRAKPGVSKSGALTANLRSSSIYKHIWGCLSSAKQLRSSSIYKIIEVVFHWTKIEVVFHLQNKLRSSSIYKKLRSSSIDKNVEVVFHLPRYGCRLPFAKILRSSSIGQSTEVVFHLETNCCHLPYRVSLTRILFWLKKSTTGWSESSRY